MPAVLPYVGRTHAMVEEGDEGFIAPAEIAEHRGHVELVPRRPDRVPKARGDLRCPPVVGQRLPKAVQVAVGDSPPSKESAFPRLVERSARATARAPSYSSTASGYGPVARRTRPSVIAAFYLVT